MLVAGYFAYWHDGYYLGPRFMYPLLPVLVLWTVRLPSLVRERGSPAVTRGVLFGYGISAIIACIAGVPVRVSQYSGMFPIMRWNVSETAHAAGVRDAIVLVRETWGAQLLARMWALGLPRPEAERIFRHVDACRLEDAISALEVHGDGRSSTPAAALSAIAPLMADSSRLVRSPFSPDSSERFEPGRPYRALCVERINDDRGGTTLLAPLLLARTGICTSAICTSATGRFWKSTPAARCSSSARPRVREGPCRYSIRFRVIRCSRSEARAGRPPAEGVNGESAAGRRDGSRVSARGYRPIGAGQHLRVLLMAIRDVVGDGVASAHVIANRHTALEEPGPGHRASRIESQRSANCPTASRHDPVRRNTWP